MILATVVTEEISIKTGTSLGTPRIFSRKSRRSPIAERLILAGFRRYFILCFDAVFVTPDLNRDVSNSSRNRAGSNRAGSNKAGNRAGSNSSRPRNTIPRRARKRKETLSHPISIPSFFIL